MRYECISRRRNQYPVKLMCKLLEVSRSGFYAWQGRPESQRAQDDRHLLQQIKRIHAASGGVYGAPRITAELREEGYECGRRRVARLMRQAGLRGCPKRRFRVTTQRDPAHAVADNLLQQNFSASRPNQHWAADITYISTQQGWLYLAVVMDLYSRRIVGWSMDRWNSRHIAINALNMALEQRQPEGVLLHHSDRGAQYTSDDFRNELKKHGIKCSMSARGNCYDNAVVESFFGLLKRERVNRTRYLTRDEAKQDVFEYIECFYNRKRRHGRLGNISPDAFEKMGVGQSQPVH